MFEDHAKIFELVPDSFARKEDHKILFATLTLIFKKTRLSRFLSEAEINELELNISSLSTIIFLRFKEMSITLKMHDILCHTMHFVRKYHSVGFFGEQAIESLHQIMNKDELKFVHLNKHPVSKTKFCFDQQNIRALLN